MRMMCSLSPVAIDLEDILRRALCAQAGACDVVIGFENGVGVLCMCGKGKSFVVRCNSWRSGDGEKL